MHDLPDREDRTIVGPLRDARVLAHVEFAVELLQK
jgi:hypothetical protein